MSSLNKNNGFWSLLRNKRENKQEVVSITYEEIGLFPRSFSRVLDRFLKQVFSDVENLVIQEYRFYRYLFLTTLKCILILFFVPFFVNFLAKTYVVRPLTEYFWNTKQTEIFLNSYQQKRAFAELKEFEEKTYFESLIFPKSVFVSSFNSSPVFASLPLADSESVALGLGVVPLKEKPPLPSDLNQKDPSLFPSLTLQSNKGFAAGTEQRAAREDEQRSEYASSSSKGALLLSNEERGLFAGTDQEGLSQRRKGRPGESEKVETEVSGSSLATKKDLSVLDQREGFAALPSSVGEGREQQTDFLINSYTMKSSLFVYQTQEADKNIQQRYQEKTIELAQRYNDQSIAAITNFFADLISLCTLFYLLYALEIQINITKSFLLEVFFGLDDSKKSLLILLITDLLVGYHSSNLWELFFEFLFHHYGLPESQTGIFLLVATLPVLLDVLFKYLIFRHLNRSSPATVATYHAMIE